MSEDSSSITPSVSRIVEVVPLVTTRTLAWASWGSRSTITEKRNRKKIASMVFIFLLHITNPPFFMSIPAVTEQRPGYSMNSWSSAAEQYKQTLSLISL